MAPGVLVSPVEVDKLSQQYSASKSSAAKPASATSYEILDQPSRSTRRLRVVTIGAGASAINFAHDVDTSSLDIDLTCYDKNPEIGGTWYENRYPGCACDIPSVNYQLSWAPGVWPS